MSETTEQEMDRHIRSGWWSWLEPAVALSKVFPNERILELGSGHGSKFWLEIEGVKGLLSVDSSEAWSDATQTDDRRHISIWARKGEPSYVNESILEDRFDFALVDGINENRVQCVNLLLHRNLSRIVLIHDFGPEDTGYHWEWIVNPSGWHILRYTGNKPNTGIACREQDLATVLATLHGKVEQL